MTTITVHFFILLDAKNTFFVERDVWLIYNKRREIKTPNPANLQGNDSADYFWLVTTVKKIPESYREL
jgi:hypothetical protein